MMRFLLLVILFAAPVVGQVPPAPAPVPARPTFDDPDQAPPPAAATIQPLDAMEQARAAAARGDMAEALSRYLRLLSTKPDDMPALIGAGQAALAVGDLNAANGFFARADSLSPNNAAVKAGLGSVLVQQGNARDALRYFRAASTAGVPDARIAADRGLAYDLRGEPRRAQLDYRVALGAKPGDAMILRRLALSQAISGEQSAALATLDPLLRRQDVAAWRTRMFVRALTGDIAGAETDAPLVLPPAQVAALKPYLERLTGLHAADKAAAVFLGHFPPPGQTSGPAHAAPVVPRVAAVPPLPQPALSAEAAAAAPPPPPVDTGTVKPPAPSVAERKPTRAEAARTAREKTLADAKAAREKAATEAKQAAKKNPERHWVQLAGGANKHDLPKAWRQLKDRYGSQIAGRSPVTMHYRYTNRLMIGPFPSAAAAQAWVTEHKKQGLTSFPVTTRAGEAVEPVGGE